MKDLMSKEHYIYRIHTSVIKVVLKLASIDNCLYEFHNPIFIMKFCPSPCFAFFKF